MIQTTETAERSLPVLNRRETLPTETEFRERIKLMRLPYLRFSLTPDCNASCDFCHNEGQKIGLRAEGNRAPAKLGIDQIAYIADFFAPHFREVKFTGGEPTLIENVADIVRVFSERGYTPSMITNGFYLDRKLQADLREAGLDKVNMSLGTMNPEQHAEFFGVPGQLENVLSNLAMASRNFREVKVNFMASGETVPSQVYPISELSSDLSVTVSCLELVKAASLRDPIHPRLVEELEKIGVAEVRSEPDRFHFKSLYTLQNGAVWEIDDFRRAGYRQDAFDNAYCQDCSAMDRCVEGPYALRVGYDGALKTCLIRGDNTIRLGEDGFVFAEEKDE